MAKEGVKVVTGATGSRTYSQAEKRSYCDFINRELAEDQDLAALLPMDPQTDDLFNVISKGILLW